MVNPELRPTILDAGLDESWNKGRKKSAWLRIMFLKVLLSMPTRLPLNVFLMFPTLGVR